MKILLTTFLGLFLIASNAYAGLSPELITVRADWAKIKYKMPEDQRVDALKDLAERAHAISQVHPDTAEPMIWEAIVLSTLAGEDSGLGALSQVKQAKKLLEQAEKIDPNSLNGSIYTSLGSLYYQVPGWPLGFGDDDKADEYLKKALAMNPDGIDSNFFYGDYLMHQGKYQEAIAAFDKALNAPARPDRPIADAGRKKEVYAAMAKAKQKL